MILAIENWEITQIVLNHAGGKYTTPYRYSVPTQLHGLIHNVLEHCKRKGDFKMPKVYIDGGCHIVFSKDKRERRAQQGTFSMICRATICRYERKFGAWDVQNKVVPF